MGTYSYTGSVQTATVGTAGVYDIVAYGGKGGHPAGGKGAEEGGDFNLSANEKLKIVVGGMGNYVGGSGSGGGASFVLGSTDGGATYTLLVAAGGGGGDYLGANGGAGLSTATTAHGNGSGGGALSTIGGGGGAGFKGNGGGNVYGSASSGPSYAGGPGLGHAVGGFGGGGGGTQRGGGGGGGYTGGNGGYTTTASRGGTSFLGTLADSQHTVTVDGENAAAGRVVITLNAVCFAAGTLIRTTRGDVAVEALVIGDLVVTSSGAHRPIKWVGHRTTDCRNHSRPAEIMPVRISAHALGTNKPARDLFVSPGHAICVTMIDEVLIPASALVNGTTIRQVDVDEVTYWHVELDDHDVIVAENLPAESYLDMGNRGFFAKADVVDLDARPDTSRTPRTHADFCRPFHSDGRMVEAVRSHLGTRRATLGWTLAHEPMGGLHLIADGVRIEPAIRDLTARFSVPAGARDVWLVSNSSRPNEISDSVDGRDLGICIGALTIDDGFGTSRVIALDDPLLCVGFHHLEEDVRRWTAGRARLSADLWADCPDGFFLRVDCAQPALPRWVAPVADAALARTPSERRASLHLVA